MKKLVAGPWVGEFGYFLFTWQARLRWLSKNEYDEVVVVCRPGEEYVFEDFADEILFWNQECPDSAAGSKCKGFSFTDTYAVEGYDRILPNTRIAHYRWRKKEQPDPCFVDQDYRRFGAELKAERYDVLLHIRTTEKVGQAYKNAFDGWDLLMDSFKGLKVACIGIKAQAGLLAGADDKRGLPLRELAAVMAAAGVVVGASSGPIHYAALCGLPQVTWVGRPLRRKSLRRYTHHWNPFEVPVKPFFVKDWNPDTDVIIEAAHAILGAAI